MDLKATLAAVPGGCSLGSIVAQLFRRSEKVTGAKVKVFHYEFWWHEDDSCDWHGCDCWFLYQVWWNWMSFLCIAKRHCFRRIRNLPIWVCGCTRGATVGTTGNGTSFNSCMRFYGGSSSPFFASYYIIWYINIYHERIWKMTIPIPILSMSKISHLELLRKLAVWSSLRTLSRWRVQGWKVSSKLWLMRRLLGYCWSRRWWHHFWEPFFFFWGKVTAGGGQHVSRVGTC